MNRRIKNPGKFWDKAWSLVDQCTPVSEGCRNCWLKTLNKRTGKPWDGNVTFRADRLDIPLRARKPTVFAIWSDLYHEAVTDEQICEAFKVMWRCPQHTFLVVTKRPERASKFFSEWVTGFPPKSFAMPDNVYHLVTVENQAMADKRIPHALKIPGKVGLLIEPMLGPVDLKLRQSDKVIHILEKSNSFPGVQHSGKYGNHISCVLLGGETGPHARPMHPDRARSVRDQCHMAGIPFYLKHIDKKHGRILDEQEHNDLPWRAK